MFTNLNVFRLSHAMAAHAGARQGLIAQNMANADTPGYRPKDLRPFHELASDLVSGRPAPNWHEMTATRPGHIGGSAGAWSNLSAETEARSGSEPNKNAVSVEEEMFRAVQARRQHDRALAIYKSSLSVLRTSLGRS